jgi:hypothetical protein
MPGTSNNIEETGTWNEQDYMNAYLREAKFVKTATTEISNLLSDLDDMQAKMKEMSDKIDECLAPKNYD